MVDAAFWASLQREEGYPPEISLAVLPPERALRPLMFAGALPLGPRALARLAPAVQRPGIHLGVWRESIVRPIAYAVEPPFAELADPVRGPAAGGASRRDGALGRVVDAVAGLTAVNGATLITSHYELLAFGVKIGRPDGRPRVELVDLSEPIEGGAAAVVNPLQLGGTRHISAAQFAQDQPDAVALVASQDGRFTIFAWSPRDGLVHAHRVETLLL